MSIVTSRQADPKPVQWLSPMGFLGVGVLEIKGVPYTVERVEGAFRLTNHCNGNVYTVADGKCSCPDATQRNRTCKHATALSAA